MNDNPTTKNKYSSIIILLLVVCLGYTGYLISSINKKNHEISKELSSLLMENNEMNKILLNEDALSASKAFNLKDNLKLLLVSYDSLELSNTMVVDSINQQREKIKTLMTKVDKLNSKSKKDWRSIFKLKKEAWSTMKITKFFYA